GGAGASPRSSNWRPPAGTGGQRNQWKGRLMPRDVYLQPDARDPVLDPDAALALVRRHVPAARTVAGVDESGGEARTYAVDAGAEALVLKVQRPQQLRPRDRKS